MNKHIIPILVILLFIVSAISPMVIGFKSDAIADVNSEMEELLDNLAFYCYDASGSNAKYEYMKEQLLEDYSNDDIEIVEEVVQSEEPISTALSGGSMDSPWPMKCHDNRHTSRSPYSTANNSGFEKWRFKTKWVDGTIESSAVIGDDGTIYFGSMGSDRRLYALYPNGTEKWSYQVGLLIWSTPAIAEDGTIYVTSYDAKLYALYSNNGTLKWTKSGGGSISSSPAIGEYGTIYFGGFNNNIYAVNPNGTEKWHYDTGYWIVSDPAIGDDGTIYIGSGDTYFYALNPNGTLKWRFKTGDIIKAHASVAEDGTIYISSWDDYLYALYPNGTMKWKVNTEYGATGGAAIAEDGTIYLFTDKLRAIYPNNGTIKWSLDIGGDGGHTSPAISSDGTIYTCNDDGKSIIAVNPDGTEKWRKQISNLRTDSSPCIGGDGTIYVGSSWKEGVDWVGYLHAFGAGGELEADANGPYYGLINLPVQFSGSVSNGYPPYTWHWDFGDSETSDEQNPIHTYTDAGNYTVTLTVTDNSSNTSDDTTWAWIQESNDPPDKPSIDGETNGNIETKYDYNFLTSDPEGLQVWYYIEWGDDTNTGWIGPYPSGEEITKSHSWSKKDTYIIRCKAKDPYGDESDWSTLEVTMPKSKPFNFNFPLISWLLERFPILQRLLGFIWN